MNDSNIPLDIVNPVSHSKIPPWKLLKPEIDTFLSELRKLKQILLFSNKNYLILNIQNTLELRFILMVQRTKIKWLPLQ